MSEATHNVAPDTEKQAETYEAKRQRQRTRREERAQKRAFLELKGRLRSQLRRQLDEIMNPNINDLIVALIGGKGIKLVLQVGEAAPAVTAVPEPETKPEPLIQVVR